MSIIIVFLNGKKWTVINMNIQIEVNMSTRSYYPKSLDDMSILIHINNSIFIL